MLSNEEIAYVLRVIARLPHGKYTVKRMFAEDWEGNHRPRNYGKRFKASVDHDDVPGVSWVGTRSNKSHEYEVLTEPTTKSSTFQK